MEQVQLVKSDGTQISPSINTTTIGDSSTELNLNGSTVDITGTTTITGQTTINGGTHAISIQTTNARGAGINNSSTSGPIVIGNTSHKTTINGKNASITDAATFTINAVNGGVTVNGDLSVSGTISGNAATTSVAGLMSAADKKKLDGLGNNTVLSMTKGGSRYTMSDLGVTESCVLAITMYDSSGYPTTTDLISVTFYGPSDQYYKLLSITTNNSNVIVTSDNNSSDGGIYISSSNVYVSIAKL